MDHAVIRNLFESSSQKYPDIPAKSEVPIPTMIASCADAIVCKDAAAPVYDAGAAAFVPAGSIVSDGS